MAEQTISIILNGEAKEVAADQTGVQLFAEDKNIIAVRLNGEPRDLYTELHDGDVVEPIVLDSEDGLAIMRHSATHVMAQAVQEIRPDAKLGVGPVIKDGFYYDFDVETPFTPDDLKEIEKRMQRIIKSSQSFRRRVVTEEEALAEEADQPYKLELIKDKEAHLDPEAATEISGKELSFYDNVDRDGNVVWKDLCRDRTCRTPAISRRSRSSVPQLHIGVAAKLIRCCSAFMARLSPLKKISRPIRLVLRRPPSVTTVSLARRWICSPSRMRSVRAWLCSIRRALP